MNILKTKIKTKLTINAPCYNMLRCGDLIFSSTERQVKIHKEDGSVSKYRISHPSYVCYDASSKTLAVIATSGQLYYINDEQGECMKVQIRDHYEGAPMVNINGVAYWVDWKGRVHSFDFSTKTHKTELVIEGDVATDRISADLSCGKIVILAYDRRRDMRFLVFFSPGDINYQTVYLDDERFGYIDTVVAYNQKLYLTDEFNSQLAIFDDYLNNPCVSEIIKLNGVKSGAVTAISKDGAMLAVSDYKRIIVFDIQKRKNILKIKDRYVSSLSFDEENNLCIGTWEKGYIVDPLDA